MPPSATYSRTQIDEELIGEDEAVLEDWKVEFDRYQPLKRIGSGSTGAVFLCFDKILNKKVAIKCLLRSTSEKIIAFQNEAKAHSKLRHPNIVTVLDFGISKTGIPYLVMDFVDGKSLEHNLTTNGILSVPQALKVAQGVCDGLKHAHEANIFHRDVQSSNILLVRQGSDFRPVLIDFGTAKEQTLTAIDQSRTLAGTPAYMAPDVVAGHKYDARSEVYSLGCVLFEAITGQTPFRGDTPLDTLYLHANEETPTLAEVLGEPVSSSVESLVAKCLAKDASQRFQSMGELKESLDEMVTIFSEKKVAPGKHEAPDPRLIVTVAKEEVSSFTQSRQLALSVFVLLVSGLIIFGTYSLLFNDSQQVNPDTAAGKHTKPVKRVQETEPLAEVPDEPDKPLRYWSASTLLKRATTRFHNGDHKTAIEYCDRALSVCLPGERMEILTRKGDVLADQDDLKSALTCYSQAIEEGEELPEFNQGQLFRALRLRARVYMRLKKPELALADLDRDLELEKLAGVETDGVHSERSKVYTALGKFGKAIKELTMAIKLKGPSADTSSLYAERSKLYERVGRNTNAGLDRYFADPLSK